MNGCIDCLVKELNEARAEIVRLKAILDGELEGIPVKVQRAEPKVFYECDRRKCEMCSYPECNKTADITHAQNFRSDGLGSYEEIMNEA